ncbi:MAG: EAL domain-containing protein [Pseudobutyrivibrio sp.]|nr:EAL domain-containing protein [Pseudobutyrivibrio sp.]
MERYEFAELQRKALEALNIPLVIYQFIDNRVVTLLVTDGMSKLMGVSKEEIIDLFDKDMYKDTHPDDKARVADAAYKFASGTGNYDVVYRSMSKKINDYVIVHAHGEHYFAEHGEMLSTTVYMVEGLGGGQDDKITGEIASNYQDLLKKESLIRDNFYDSLTGLPNMSYFLMLADAGKKALIEEGLSPCMLFFDLTGMKFFNQKYSIHEGDNLICAFGQILKNHFSTENCGRLSQDHFAAYTASDGLEEELEQIFDELQKANEEKTLPVRVGIYSITYGDVTSSAACDRAKIACDQGRGSYNSKYYYYSDELHKQMLMHQYVVNNFERAMENRWILPYYQEIVRSVNGCVCDEEALARWIDPEKGLLPPDKFIPVLEDTQLIHKLDLYLLDRVLEDLKETKDTGHPFVPVSINLSRNDFVLCDIVGEIISRVEASEFTPDYITIEITESVSSLDISYIGEQIKRFHDAGFKVWMDDFGSGYSSLNILQKLDFDTIKFDLRFMREFGESKKSHIILEELVKMATKLGIETVVEGVETIEQVKFLREIGAIKQQGYYYAKPISLNDWFTIFDSRIGLVMENKDELDYYNTIGSTNLVEPKINADYNWQLDEFFGQIPMGIIEVKNRATRILRYNNTFAKFLIKTDYTTEDKLGGASIPSNKLIPIGLNDALKKAYKTGKWEYMENIGEDSLSVNCFIKYLSGNQVSGFYAFEIVILSMDTIDKD